MQVVSQQPRGAHALPIRRLKNQLQNSCEKLELVWRGVCRHVKEVVRVRLPATAAYGDSSTILRILVDLDRRGSEPGLAWKTQAEVRGETMAIDEQCMR